jgi:O-antigen/teichoic acid export membrane protein
VPRARLLSLRKCGRQRHASRRVRSMSVKRNTLINFAGSLVPLLISLVFVPLYLRLVGEARYGVLALAWLFLDYFGFFDLGIGKATANQLARLRDAPTSARSAVFWVGMLINGVLGTLGGIALLIAGQYVLGGYFANMTAELHDEISAAAPWLALAVPVGTLSAVGVAALEARERFFALNALQVLISVLLQVVPIAIAWCWGPALDALIAAAVICRMAAGLLLFLACWRYVPLQGSPSFRKALAGPLFRYGGWVTVTALIGPILVSVDRVLIGWQIGPSAVAHYTVPYNIVTKLQILPASLTRALFPRFSLLEREESTRMAEQAVFSLAAITLPLIVFATITMAPFLTLWVGPEFAEVAAPLGEILLAGVWINGLAWIPFAMLQGQGRPDVVAKFHAIELIPYAVVLWIGLAYGGLSGAAWAWVLRVIIDAILMFAAAGLLSRVSFALCTGTAFIIASHLGLHFAPHTLVIHVGVAVLLLISATSYSIRITPADLRQTLARAAPFASARLGTMKK